MEFLFDCKAHIPTFLFPLRAMGCISLVGFEHGVWVIESSYIPFVISKALL